MEKRRRAKYILAGIGVQFETYMDRVSQVCIKVSITDGSVLLTIENNTLQLYWYKNTNKQSLKSKTSEISGQ